MLLRDVIIETILLLNPFDLFECILNIRIGYFVSLKFQFSDDMYLCRVPATIKLNFFRFNTHSNSLNEWLQSLLK